MLSLIACSVADDFVFLSVSGSKAALVNQGRANRVGRVHVLRRCASAIPTGVCHAERVRSRCWWAYKGRSLGRVH